MPPKNGTHVTASKPRRWRRYTAAAGAVIAAVTMLTGVANAASAPLTVSEAGAAQAVTPPSKGGATFITPPAPRGARRLSGANRVSAAATYYPGISPSPYYSITLPPGNAFTCQSGILCAAAWDSLDFQWVIFYLYYCTTYDLTNWIGNGWYQDAQTGSTPPPRSVFYDQYYNELLAFTPDGGIQHDYDWTNVWHIKNC